MKQENEERQQAKVAEAKEIIRRIGQLREHRESLAQEISEQQELLRNIAPAEMLADNVLGD